MIFFSTLHLPKKKTSIFYIFFHIFPFISPISSPLSFSISTFSSFSLDSTILITCFHMPAHHQSSPHPVVLHASPPHSKLPHISNISLHLNNQPSTSHSTSSSNSRLYYSILPSHPLLNHLHFISFIYSSPSHTIHTYFLCSTYTPAPLKASSLTPSTLTSSPFTPPRPANLK